MTSPQEIFRLKLNGPHNFSFDIIIKFIMLYFGENIHLLSFKINYILKSFAFSFKTFFENVIYIIIINPNNHVKYEVMWSIESKYFLR